MKAVISLALALALSAGAAQGQGMKGMDMKDMPMKDMGSDAKAPGKAHSASGTVTKVDRDKAKVTIRHAPVASMNWPSMTMTFAVKDKALLDKAKPGSKVDFSFVQSGRDYVITELK